MKTTDVRALLSTLDLKYTTDNIECEDVSGNTICIRIALTRDSLRSILVEEFRLIKNAIHSNTPYFVTASGIITKYGNTYFVIYVMAYEKPNA